MSLLIPSTHLQLTRRALLLSAAAAAASSHAQDAYPNRPVRIIVSTAPGAGGDTITRKVAASFPEKFGQRVIVENRPGASQLIAAETVARSAPDGYTLLQAGGTLSIVMAKDPPPKIGVNDLDSVIALVASPFVLVINKALPPRTFPEFVSWARAHPTTLMYGSNGVGGALHLEAEILMRAANFKATHVPYKSVGSQLQGVVANEVGMAILGAATAKPFIDSGALVALAVLGKAVPALPNVPEISRFVPDYVDASSWQGFLAPKGTPKPIIDKLHAHFSEIVKGELRDELEKMGFVVLGQRPEHLHQTRLAEVKKWRELIRVTGIKLE